MNMNNPLTRPLDISEIDFRIQSINNGGYATILAYKDARTDMSRLDEAFGPFGWQKAYSVINDSLFCGVGILDRESAAWVWKWDVGTESNTEKEKGQASDAFKRACFNLGIGRELYEYPVISVKLFDNEYTKDGGRPKQTWNLKLRDWTWYSEFTDGKISFLAAKDENGKVRFQWGKLAEKKEKPVEVKDEANVKGILKKKKDEEDPERDAAISEYKAIFGKSPHGRMSTENIQKAIDEELSKELSEDKEDDYIDFSIEETDKNSEYKEYLDKIETFDDPNDFSEWAREVLGEVMDSWDEDMVDEFKDKCNKYYKKIT
jgi:hypothetical protein